MFKSFTGIIISSLLLSLLFHSCVRPERFTEEKRFHADPEQTDVSGEWIFYPGGDFLGNVELQNRRIHLQGTYEIKRDSYDDDFSILLDTNRVGEYDILVTCLDGGRGITFSRNGEHFSFLSSK